MPPRPLTQPLTPKLATEVRSKVKREAEGETADEEERRKVTFKAQPLPKDIFEKVKVKKISVKKLIVILLQLTLS